MTRDEEVLQTFEEKTSVILGKAQQYLSTALPGGVGVFSYVVMSNLIGKLFGHTRRYVESAIARPVTLPDFVYVEPLDEELEVFFDSDRLQSIRAEFPAKYEDFSDNDWGTMRRYYMPLYYTLIMKEPFVSEMFAFEIQSQNYKRIIYDFDLFSSYKKAVQSAPTASKQNALWNAVTSVLKGTVNEVWNKDYATQLFEEARTHPEVAALIEDIKVKIGDKVDLEKVSELRETIQYLTGRSVPQAARKNIPVFPMKTVEYTGEVLPDGKVELPQEVLRSLHLRSGSKVKILLMCDE
jgi:hypothetical protein